MFRHKTAYFSLYFGDSRDNLYQEIHLNLGDIKPDMLAKHDLFKQVAHPMGLESLVFLRQTHSTHGQVINAQKSKDTAVFAQEGDYLVTDKPHVGIGVMTADCLPIVFYDSCNNAVGIAHAGWRGTVAGIAGITLDRMKKEYATDPAQVQIFFGPSGRACCYEVSPDFITNLRADLVDSVIQERTGDLFFDVSEYNKRLLQECGVSAQAINDDYNICTICDESFFSYRRQGPKAGRQMTIVAADQMAVVSLV